MAKKYIHECIICTHKDREEIERKYLDGWLLRDIVLHHKLVGGIKTLQTHIKSTHLNTEKNEAKRTSIRNFCLKVMQSSLPIVESGKVTVQDGLDAVKILARLGEDDKIEQIWKIVMTRGEEISARPTPQGLPDQTQSLPLIQEVYDRDTQEVQGSAASGTDGPGILLHVLPEDAAT